MKIKKRSGKIEELDISQIQEYTAKAVEGLSGVSQSELEVDARIDFNAVVKSSDIQTQLIRTAVDKIDIDVPNWTFVAARMQLFDYYHKVNGFSGYSTFAENVERLHEENKMLTGLAKQYNLDILDLFVDPSRDYEFNYLGIKTLHDRYLIKDSNDLLIELPQHMFMGIAMFLMSIEESISSEKTAWLIEAIKRKAKEKGEVVDLVDFVLDAKLMARTYYTVKLYDIISSFEVMMATPTLSNARTHNHQLSSCYIGSSPDSIEGIFDSYKMMALLSKFGGGIGWDWSNVRAGGSSIDGNPSVAGGTTPFLKITNDVAIAVDQLGTRKGAIAPYIEPWHLDIDDFLDLKKNSGEERRRAHDLFPALWIPDVFMERVKADGDWTLFDPFEIPLLTSFYGDKFKEEYELAENSDHLTKRTIKAKDLWKKILVSYFETGLPFLTFKDNANRANPNAHCGVIRSSNLCTEIFQNTEPSKYKVKVEFESGEEATFDPAQPVEVDSGAVKIASKLTSIDSIGGEKVFFADKEAYGGEVAVCNLASINLSRINTKEDIERVVPIVMRALDNVVTLNFYPVRETKVTNTKKRPVGLGVMGESEMLAEAKIFWGTDEHLFKIDEIMEQISFNVISASSDLAVEKGSYPDYEGSNWSKGIFPIDLANANALDLLDRKRIYDWESLKTKVVNQGMRNGYTMAVAPTSSISILTGTTQAIEPVFKRKWFEENLSGLIPVVVPKLSPENFEYYESAYDLPQEKLIRAAAIRQKWIDQGQSLNIFMTLEKASGRYLNEIYMLAWKLGLKSTYYLRSQSAEVKGEEIDEAEDRSQECVGCQ